MLKFLDPHYFQTLRPDMTEKLLTGTLSLNTNKQFPNPVMYLVHVLFDDKYRSKILGSTIPTPVHDLKVKVTDLKFSC